jgi:cold shock protein
MGKVVQELWSSDRPALDDGWPFSPVGGEPASRRNAAGRPEAARAFRPSTAGADPLAEGMTVEAVVKWFNAEKGYGFVELSSGGDAFLHLKVLRLVGRETLPSGARIRAVVGDGPRGAQVLRVAEIDASSAIERPDRPGRRPIPDPSTAVDLTGKVKWFDGARGFGFVASDDFGRDVFIHSSTLGSSGVARLSEGQAVTMRVVETPKGREAIEIAV